MDIKQEIEKVVKSITGDQAKIDAFKKDPAGTVKEYLGDSVSSDVVDKVVSGVNAKIAGNKISDAASSIGGLFKK